MVKGKLLDEKVIVEDPEGHELFTGNWYGKLNDSKLELDLLEAAFLSERGRVEIEGNEPIKFHDFIHLCSEKDPRFMARFIIYKDLRERGLAVRLGFEGSDFRVYDRGAKPDKAEGIKWIVFASSEDYPCHLEQLGKAMKLASNIRATALWAVVDNDSDVTYYIISEAEP